MSDDDEENELQRPSWVRQVCLQRDYFDGCALAFVSDSGDAIFYKVLYCTRNPVLVCLSPIENAMRPTKVDVVSAGNWMELADNHEEFCGTVQWHVVVGWEAVSGYSTDDMFVLPDVRYLGGQQVSSRLQPVPLPVFLGWLPSQRDGNEQEQKRPRQELQTTVTGISPDDIANHPWLAQYMPQSRDASGHAQHPVSGLSTACEAEPVDDVDAVWAELEEKRRQLEEADVTIPDNFKVSVLGGRAAGKVSA